MKDDNELLDEIIAHLRSEPAPEMPSALTARCTAKPRGRVWLAVGAGALTASLVGILLWRPHALETHNPSLRDVVRESHAVDPESQVVIRTVDLTEPLAQVEANLDLVDAEIAELRSKAALLDARRMADDLLARY